MKKYNIKLMTYRGQDFNMFVFDSNSKTPFETSSYFEASEKLSELRSYNPEGDYKIIDADTGDLIIE
jgi:hypothetical protein